MSSRRTLSSLTVSPISQFRTNTERARMQELGPTLALVLTLRHLCVGHKLGICAWVVRDPASRNAAYSLCPARLCPTRTLYAEFQLESAHLSMNLIFLSLSLSLSIFQELGQTREVNVLWLLTLSAPKARFDEKMLASIANTFVVPKAAGEP